MEVDPGWDDWRVFSEITLHVWLGLRFETLLNSFFLLPLCSFLLLLTFLRFKYNIFATTIVILFSLFHPFPCFLPPLLFNPKFFYFLLLLSIIIRVDSNVHFAPPFCPCHRHSSCLYPQFPTLAPKVLHAVRFSKWPLGPGYEAIKLLFVLDYPFLQSVFEQVLGKGTLWVALNRL